jgi:hypothetical protein
VVCLVVLGKFGCRLEAWNEVLEGL